jgi:GAF domain-containing protein
MTDTDEPSPKTHAVEDLSDEQVAADTVDLQAGLGELASLVIGGEGLSEVLAHVATFAVRAIPGADGAGVTLLKVDRTDNMVQVLAASHPFVAEVDEIQYRALNEGPCITAVLERRTVRSGSLGGEEMWPHFGPRVGRMGIHSALSLPLLLSGQVLGAINVYAREKDAFDEHAAELAELFATPAAVAVHNAQILAQAQALATQLQGALSSRPIIDQAIGILRQRSGVTAQEAFARLRTISQAQHVKLFDVADKIVNEAVSRARARKIQS